MQEGFSSLAHNKLLSAHRVQGLREVPKCLEIRTAFQPKKNLVQTPIILAAPMTKYEFQNYLLLLMSINIIDLSPRGTRFEYHHHHHKRFEYQHHHYYCHYHEHVWGLIPRVCSLNLQMFLIFPFSSTSSCVSSSGGLVLQG